MECLDTETLTTHECRVRLAQIEVATRHQKELKAEKRLLEVMYGVRPKGAATLGTKSEADEPDTAQ